MAKPRAQSILKHKKIKLGKDNILDENLKNL